MSMKLMNIAKFCNTPFTITFSQEGISEEGEILNDISFEGKCYFSEKHKRIITQDGTRIEIVGKAIIPNDFDSNISSGNIEIYGQMYQIYSGARLRNVDGTVHHIELELM